MDLPSEIVPVGDRGPDVRQQLAGTDHVAVENPGIDLRISNCPFFLLLNYDLGRHLRCVRAMIVFTGTVHVCAGLANPGLSWALDISVKTLAPKIGSNTDGRLSDLVDIVFEILFVDVGLASSPVGDNSLNDSLDKLLM